METGEALLLVGLLGLGVFVLTRQQAGAPPPAAGAGPPKPPCGVPVSYGGVTTVVPCSTLNTAAKTIAGEVGSLGGLIGPSGALSYHAPAPDYGHTYDSLSGPRAQSFGMLADNMCSCYHGDPGTTNGLHSCQVAHALAPEIVCKTGDCDCHPTFKDAAGNITPNPTPATTQICWRSAQNPTPKCYTPAYFAPGGIGDAAGYKTTASADPINQAFQLYLANGGAP